MPHTPGPWFFDQGKRVWAKGETDGTVCVAGWIDNPDNAHLIAAAPDLKAALTDMLAGWRYIREHHGDLYGVGWDRCEEAAKAALAKIKDFEVIKD